MAFNGSGVFQRLHNWVNDANGGIKIRADRMDAEMDGFATGLSGCVTKDGQTTITANLPMATFKFTGLGSGSARTDSINYGQVQDGKANWVDGGGSADAITATYSPAITTLVDGQECFVRATAANATTTPTFSPNGLTASTIVKQGGAALVAGDIAGDGHNLHLRYDLANTRWELLNPAILVTLAGNNAFTGSNTFSGNVSISGTSSAASSVTLAEDTDNGTNTVQIIAPASVSSNRVATLQDASGTIAYTSDIDFIRNYLTGLTLSNDTDTDHDINITAGQASDSTNTDIIVLSSEITKQIDAAWSVGNDAGGLDTGTVANSTWYHIHLIKRSDTGVVDALFSTSATAPTMPTNYDLRRRIGSVLTDGSANIIAFSQNGDEFLWSAPVNNVSTTNPGTSATLRTLTVPTGVKVFAKTTWRIWDTSPSAARWGLVTSPDQSDTTPSSTLNNLSIVDSSASTDGDSFSTPTRTNTSAQVRTRFSASDANLNLNATTLGWIDTRGR